MPGITDMTKFAVFTDEGFPLGFYAEGLHGLREINGKPNPHCIIPTEAIEITNQQWRTFIDHQGMRKWQDGHAVPYEPPAPETIIPDRLSRRQFRRALIDAGLLEQVET